MKPFGAPPLGSLGTGRFRTQLRMSWAALLLCAGCSERHAAIPPAPTETAPSASSSAFAAAPASTGASAALPSASASVPLASASATPAPAPHAEAAPESALLGDDGKALPQTEERPKTDTLAFQRRVERLVEAIIKDQPELAHPSFFPVIAYEQVKAIDKPARDWEVRLVRAFDRDIHEYHQKLGADAADAEFLGLDVPESAARWMKPGSEGNRLGYFRVLRSQLKFKLKSSQELALVVTSMISWRGEWYVVHLGGFK